jgi:NADP-reducing hydrogenase subunit HndA
MSVQFVETTEQSQQLKKALSELKSVKGAIVMAMQRAQDIYGYLPIEVQTRIADAFDIPLEEVYGIATFYAQFNINPAGKYKVGVCLGTACYVRGSGEIIAKIEEKLNVKPGQTTPDGKFTLEATRCIGCCGLAPVLTVGDRVYGNLTTADVEKILYEYND